MPIIRIYLLHKIEQLLPTQYSQLLKSYLSDRYFRVKLWEEYSDLKPSKAGVPHGSVLGPVLYLIFTNDISQPTGTTVATFADDTAILAVGVTWRQQPKSYNKRQTQ